MKGDRMNPIQKWHDYVEANDMSKLDELLADNVVFQSPAVHTPQEGKAITAKYLRAAMVVLNQPGFTYIAEWHAEKSAVLEFEVKIDDIYVNGVDIIQWNAEGRIVNFKVMIRPLKGLNKVVAMMAEQLQAKPA
jgi:ketosteroid isomerase-like protein